MKNTQKGFICRPTRFRTETLRDDERGSMEVGQAGGTQGRNIGVAKGFTLIELLVVVLIIGILAAVAIPQYQKAVEKSRATEAIIQVKALADAEKIYYMANGHYAENFSELDVNFSGTGDEDVKKQNYWDLVLTQIKNANLVYARRMGTGFELGDGRWYIDYDLETGHMFCVAYSSDVKATRICKAFGTAMACPSWGTTGSVCYPID